MMNNSTRRRRLELLLQENSHISPKIAAEISYALAMVCREMGDSVAAARHKEQSIALTGQAGIRSLEDAAHSQPFWEDVAIPDLFHEDVVRDRLRDV